MAKPTKETRIKQEITRLNKLLADIGPDRLKSVEKLVARAAFYAITLEDLEETINAEGCVDRYQNGENQWGTKRSASADLHVSMFRNFLAAIKQLVELLPEDEGKKKSDLMAYVDGK